MNTTLNATAMNSTEKMNSVFGDIYDFLEENWENNPYWLVFICTLMWVVYPFAYGYFIYNAISDVPLISEHIRPRSFTRRNRRRNQRNRVAVRT